MHSFLMGILRKLRIDVQWYLECPTFWRVTAESRGKYAQKRSYARSRTKVIVPAA